VPTRSSSGTRGGSGCRPTSPSASTSRCWASIQTRVASTATTSAATFASQAWTAEADRRARRSSRSVKSAVSSRAGAGGASGNVSGGGGSMAMTGSSGVTGGSARRMSGTPRSDRSALTSWVTSSRWGAVRSSARATRAGWRGAAGRPGETTRGAKPPRSSAPAWRRTTGPAPLPPRSTSNVSRLPRPSRTVGLMRALRRIYCGRYVGRAQPVDLQAREARRAVATAVRTGELEQQPCARMWCAGRGASPQRLRTRALARRHLAVPSAPQPASLPGTSAVGRRQRREGRRTGWACRKRRWRLRREALGGQLEVAAVFEEDERHPIAIG
jgi:hypothetical protein